MARGFICTSLGATASERISLYGNISRTHTIRDAQAMWINWIIYIRCFADLWRNSSELTHVAECGNAVCLITPRKLFSFMPGMFPSFLGTLADSPVFCVGNFVISRLCKLFLLLARERTSESLRKRAKKFLSSLTATTQSRLLLLEIFCFAFRSCMSHFSQESYFWTWTLGGKLAAFHSSADSGKVSPWKVAVGEFTWLATGSRMDSMVFVWKTGIVWRWVTNYQRNHSETSIFLADSLNSKSTSERILLETPIFIFSDSVLHKFWS